MKDSINQGFLAACAFVNWDNPDWEYTATQPSARMLAEIEAVVERFSKDNNEAIEQYLMAHDDQNLLSVGNDLYYNLAGHGCGFWEQASPHAKALDAWCEKYYTCDVYGGDEGLIHITFNGNLIGRDAIPLKDYGA